MHTQPITDTGYSYTLPPPALPRTLSPPVLSNLTALGNAMRAEQVADDAEMDRLHVRSDQIVDRMLAREGCLRLLREIVRDGGGA